MLKPPFHIFIFTFSSHTEYVKRESIVFILYFLNFILKILFNSEKSDRYFCIPIIEEFYRFLRQSIEKFVRLILD